MSAGPEHDQPQPEKTGRRYALPGPRRVAVLAGVVVAGLLAGAGVAFATTSSPGNSTPAAAAAAPSPSASPSLPFGLPHRLHFRMGPVFGGGPFGFAGPLGLGGAFGVIHGQYVAAKPGGGYQTIDFQNGKVTAVSSTSMTLRSADGYTHTYVVSSSSMVNARRGGIGSVKTGNQVLVRATVSGSTATAAQITDLSLFPQGFHHFWSGKNAKISVP